MNKLCLPDATIDREKVLGDGYVLSLQRVMIEGRSRIRLFIYADSVPGRMEHHYESIVFLKDRADDVSEAAYEDIYSRVKSINDFLDFILTTRPQLARKS